MANKTRPTDNGRHSFTDLKSLYDKVFIKHQKNEDGSGRTTVLLVKGNNIYVGVSKFSNRGDSYSRTHGRLIAQGRAELAHAVSVGSVSERLTASKQREKLSYSIKEANVEQVLESYLSAKVTI